MHRTIKAAALVAGLAAAASVGTGVAPAATALTASMNGAAEIPKGDPDGRGSGRITLDRAKGRVCYRITLSRVGKVGAGHIHKGKAGAAGPVVVALFGKPTSRPSGCVSGVSKSVIRSIERNPRAFYLNVHNSTYPAGAVRGQLRR